MLSRRRFGLPYLPQIHGELQIHLLFHWASQSPTSLDRKTLFVSSNSFLRIPQGRKTLLSLTGPQ